MTRRPNPPDQDQRKRALDPTRSIIVQAPAGSGKTDLLTRRFLRLLTEVDDPSQIVAITFTKAAAAEMRHRILSELEKAAVLPSSMDADDLSMEVLAARAREHANRMGWNLVEIPGQLRISTIDSFCREIAIQRPLLTTLGGSLDVSEDLEDLYRRAARNTLMELGRSSPDSMAVREAIEALLEWRDNNWQELETHLVAMLRQRDRWMQEFWLRDFNEQDETSWQRLREYLERPFGRAVASGLASVSSLLTTVAGAAEEVHDLARFACGQLGNTRFTELAEMVDFPVVDSCLACDLEQTRLAYCCLADMLLTATEGTFRKTVDKRLGFPADRKREKHRHEQLIRNLSVIPELESALDSVRDLPPARYSDEEWRIVRAGFTLLRRAAAELQIEFAEAGAVDFIEIAQIAQRILEDDDGQPSDAAITIADGIRHLLVDEFQDTSRRQHRLVASLVSAWPDTSNRSLFVVGDPMQSIYFFRAADAELFPRVQQAGLELPDRDSLPLEIVKLASNFRTQPALVHQLNDAFSAVFGINDGSNVRFSSSEPARSSASAGAIFDLHLEFAPEMPRTSPSDPDAARKKEQAREDRDATLKRQTDEIVALIKDRLGAMEQARFRGEKYRIAILGRARAALAPITQALRDVSIPFRAVELEPLADRPEVLDALALARALLNPEDRVAWLGMLRAPWCALPLDDLHALTSADDPDVQTRPVPELLRERKAMLGQGARGALDRVLQAYEDSFAIRATMPHMSSGTWLQQVWLRLGGDKCVDATGRANLDLLWRSLDKLPNGDADLTSPALNAALEKLMAQPDPASDGNWGVHVMTIHKSKGLEFEVVIVPELQARGANTRSAMFSWLERGLETPEATGEITEFLIAPFQTKGADGGAAKKWVDREYRAKESQEMRRILYVAATRAREELHLFARPSYKWEQDDPVLCEPHESLLSKAWPALEDQVRTQFEAWKSKAQAAQISSLAAGVSNVIVMPCPPRPAFLRRLPLDFVPSHLSHFREDRGTSTGVEPTDTYQRHEGSIDSRILGTAVHLGLQILAQLLSTLDGDAARSRLATSIERISAHIRAAGMSRDHAAKIAARALEIVTRSSNDPAGAWILAPHADAASEVRWTGAVSGGLRTVQADRVFRAGSTPLSEGSEAWWIIDYKTADGNSNDALPKLREMFAPQLELYANVLRKLHGPDAQIRAGLYYPRMLQFDWWEP
ncbi:UvrD-helicase domain-containing protein [Occallatibacter riparius]|uniref:DNA 3'-5' helicase n=1 Tax=Occallatibacter riparius TaxID=1002689 RepID=A0A9J7BS51_9BACT|nr:UvrD-helicase domain-containing protein [Occallatibacter riparius]UWZ83742.1 UvrD-helicase domain-containing protein [Occallatibacter riparius]